MKKTFVKSGLLFIFILFLSASCSVTPKGPANDIITNDWTAFIKANSGKYCVSLNKFEILEKSKEQSEYNVTVRISGEWNCQNDTITVNGPFNLFIKNKGKNQTVEFKMVYVKENQDWIFKGFITK
jgi:hypothetical protein